jgi:hypothetical protein
MFGFKFNLRILKDLNLPNDSEEALANIKLLTSTIIRIDLVMYLTTPYVKEEDAVLRLEIVEFVDSSYKEIPSILNNGNWSPSINSIHRDSS